MFNSWKDTTRFPAGESIVIPTCCASEFSNASQEASNFWSMTRYGIGQSIVIQDFSDDNL